MSGHSKWSTIKRQKAATDAKRGQAFTKVLREIQVSARSGGGNPDSNYRLRRAVDAAKAISMPVDNIEKAIKRGTGELEGVAYEQIRYEAYGPGGIGLLVDCLTDNKNRTVAELRNALTRHGGSLASTNAVAYQFSDKGLVTLPKSGAAEDKLFEVALEAGADDISDEGDIWEVISEPAALQAVQDAVKAICSEARGEVKPIASTYIAVAGEAANTLIELLDLLEAMDDVQTVVGNFDIDEASIS